jgi:hypothetical protein
MILIAPTPEDPWKREIMQARMSNPVMIAPGALHALNAARGRIIAYSPSGNGRARPMPVGLHRAKVLSVEGDRWLLVQGLEAIDGTPIIDIKPVLERSGDS